MANEDNTLVIGRTGFAGIVARFNTNCIVDIKIKPKDGTDVDWVRFFFDTNTIQAVIDECGEDDKREKTFTISFTAETESNDGTIGEVACEKELIINQGSEKPEPPTCDAIIVDGSREYNINSWHDSSRITDDGRFTAEIYDGVDDGIINNYEDLKNDTKFEQAKASADSMRLLDPSTGREGTIGDDDITIAVSITPEGDDFWKHNPCVAAKLQWKAKLIDEPECLTHNCSWDCWTSANPCDDICRDQAYLTGDTYLGTVRYNVSSNETGKNRLVVIYWYPDGREYTSCPSKMNMVYQPGDGGGDDKPKITIDGHDYQGTVTLPDVDACNSDNIPFTTYESLSYNISPTDANVRINGVTEGNLNAGTYNISYSAVAEDDEKTVTIEFQNEDGEKTILTINLVCGPTPCSDPCNNLSINLPVSSEGIMEVTGTSEFGSTSFTYTCCQDLFVRAEKEWVTVSKSYSSSTKRGTITLTYAVNTSTQSRTSAILFSTEENGEPCGGVTKKVILKQDGRSTSVTSQVTIFNQTTKTTPVINFYTNGIKVGGLTRCTVQGESTTSITWSDAAVPVNKIQYVENYGPVNYIKSITVQKSGQPPVFVLNNAEMTGPVGNIDLTRSFNPADCDFMTITFKDSIP